ncbi:MAG: hypothetical protein K6B41_05090 [Butyrivibrio sp.]|nr:hypothetical protein [Butyrivibrio sp.]
MAKLFQYIKSDQVLESFHSYKNDPIFQKGICIAKVGDFSMHLLKVPDDRLAITIEDEDDGQIYASDCYFVSEVTKESLKETVDLMKKKLLMIYEKDVSRKRKIIWHWYIMDWMESHGISEDVFSDEENGYKNDSLNGDRWQSFEDFLRNDYINLSYVIGLINKYELNNYEKEIFLKFVATDIFELNKQYTMEKLEKQLKEKQAKEFKRNYKFTVTVKAKSKKKALEDLKKILGDNEDFTII